mmetsp:Transcript_153197/g.285492  ORF Transcript_153197/g.285492 Transcript_153197/m.285492 type:complete len:249 (+) Transcript_153197:19-765(+)
MLALLMGLPCSPRKSLLIRRSWLMLARLVAPFSRRRSLLMLARLAVALLSPRSWMLIRRSFLMLVHQRRGLLLAVLEATPRMTLTVLVALVAALDIRRKSFLVAAASRALTILRSPLMALVLVELVSAVLAAPSNPKRSHRSARVLAPALTTLLGHRTNLRTWLLLEALMSCLRLSRMRLLHETVVRGLMLRRMCRMSWKRRVQRPRALRTLMTNMQMTSMRRTTSMKTTKSLRMLLTRKLRRRAPVA